MSSGERERVSVDEIVRGQCRKRGKQERKTTFFRFVRMRGIVMTSSWRRGRIRRCGFCYDGAYGKVERKVAKAKPFGSGPEEARTGRLPVAGEVKPGDVGSVGMEQMRCWKEK